MPIRERRSRAAALSLTGHFATVGRGRMLLLIARLRGIRLLFLDVAAIIVAAYLAISLTADRLGDALALRSVAPAVVILLAVRTGIQIRSGLYERHWRFASVPDLERIVVVSLLGSVISVAAYAALAFVANPTLPLPRSFWVIELLLTTAMVGGIRFAIRAAWDGAKAHDGPASGSVRPALLYGAGSSGAMVARSAQRGGIPGIRPMAFLDDDASMAGRVVAGLRVAGGLDALPATVALTGAEVLLITMPSASGDAVRRVYDAASAEGLEVRTVPSLTDIVEGIARGDRVRQVKVEDLLRRPIVADHVAGVADIIRDKVVMITGAGGSIGSELARQVYSIGPRRLVLVDRAESPLFEIQRELESMRSAGRRTGEVHARLGNVVSRSAMDRLIRAERPVVIFHAAAYKHVPMMEQHPSDAVQVNVGGTQALIDAAVSAGVERFVFVSTDKAVRPSSVMGATKRVAETIVADAARRTGRPYVSVRFGNVLGSNGSVVPIFQTQLERDEPLTITHPAMTRFFMTIPEAAWLILEAAALGKSGDLFVLDMGQPVRVLDLARDLVRLAGRDPDTQRFEVIGLRPGEKLHEELFYASERVEHTESAKVLRAVAPPVARDVAGQVAELLRLANGESEARLRDHLMQIVSPSSTAGPADAPLEPALRSRGETAAGAGSASPATPVVV